MKLKIVNKDDRFVHHHLKIMEASIYSISHFSAVRFTAYEQYQETKNGRKMLSVSLSRTWTPVHLRKSFKIGDFNIGQLRDSNTNQSC